MQIFEDFFLYFVLTNFLNCFFFFFFEIFLGFLKRMRKYWQKSKIHYDIWNIFDVVWREYVDCIQNIAVFARNDFRNNFGLGSIIWPGCIVIVWRFWRRAVPKLSSSTRKMRIISLSKTGFRVCFFVARFF